MRNHLLTPAALLAALLASSPADAQAQPERPNRELVKPVPQVRFQDQYAASEVRAALRGAGERLATPRCQEVVSEFKDVAGRPLEDALEELGAPADEYLQSLFFYSRSGNRACKVFKALAFTTVGSRIVYICPKRFRKAYRQDPPRAEAAIIHEMLHSLGLGENPPSPQHITSRVLAHCGG